MNDDNGIGGELEGLISEYGRHLVLNRGLSALTAQAYEADLRLFARFLRAAGKGAADLARLEIRDMRAYAIPLPARRRTR